MRVVIDTNVVISAILQGRDPVAVLRFVIADPEYEWVATDEIVAEYRAVLRQPKFGLPEAILAAWDTILAAEIMLVTAVEPVVFQRDPKDALFLACAISAGAAYLITGDKALLAARGAYAFTICTVAEFHALAN